jgi:hypothetical protein
VYNPETILYLGKMSTINYLVDGEIHRKKEERREERQEVVVPVVVGFFIETTWGKLLFSLPSLWCNSEEGYS